MNRRFLLLATVLVALNAAFWLAQSGFALSGSLGSFLFGPNMVRAEVVVLKDGVLRDYRVDRGRIRSTAGHALMLAEKDGTIVTVSISPAAQIQLNGVAAGYGQLHAGLRAMTVRDGDAAADRVEAFGR